MALGSASRSSLLQRWIKRQDDGSFLVAAPLIAAAATVPLRFPPMKFKIRDLARVAREMEKVSDASTNYSTRFLD
jgi:hypothetical protein